MKKGNAVALLPIGVFLVVYLGLGVLFEYVLKIHMGFYNIPIVVAFLVALLVACVQNRSVSFDDKLAIMGRGVGDKNIMTMILIFLVAGVFVGVVGRESANSVAYFMLSVIPPRFAVAVLFTVACFVSLAMGTSVGTITLITPIACAVSNASGFDLSLCVASVVGGSMFGDNLSFISDTTIAACNGQGCKMRDKFKENFLIALPAAIISLVVILVLSFNTEINGEITNKYNLIQIIPYVLVLIGGIIGINVFSKMTSDLNELCIQIQFQIKSSGNMIVFFFDLSEQRFTRYAIMQMSCTKIEKICDFMFIIIGFATGRDDDELTFIFTVYDVPDFFKLLFISQ